MNKLSTLLFLTLLAAPAAANPLPGSTGRGPALFPVKWKPTTVAQAKTEEKGEGETEGKGTGKVEASTNVAPGGQCTNDEQCVEGTYCDDGRCVEVQRAINILYLYYKSADRRFTEIMGFYYHKKGKDGFRVVFPFYWHFWDQEDDNKVVFPLYWSFHDKKHAVRNVVVPPFQYRRTPTEKNYRFWPLVFYTDYGKRGSGLTILPLFHRAREGTRTSTFLPVLLSGYDQDPARGYSRGLLAGLYYWHTTPEFKTKALFPLFYHSSSKERSTTWILPFNFAWRRGEDSGLLVPPLFLYTANKGGRRSRLVSPLLLYQRDDDAKLKHFGLLAPPYYHRRDQEYEIDVLFPLFLRWRNRVEESTTYVAGPMIFYNDPTGGTQVAFPLFWRFSHARTGAATSVLFPLFYRHRRAKGGSFNLLFPFYFNKHPDRWSAGLLPILYFGSGAGKRHAVLFPVFWHLKDEKGSTTVLGPAYLKTSDKGWKAGVLPLLYAASSEESSYQVLFPAFWHLRDDKEGYNTWVAGPGFYSSGKKGRIFGLLPLFAAGTWEDTSFTAVLPPLFYRKHDNKTGKGFTLAGLYYGWHEPGVKGHSIIPLAYYKREEKKQQTTAAVLPLFYYRKNPTSRLLITPAGGFHSDSKAGISEGLVGPVAWHRGPRARGFAVIPIFLHYTRPKEQSSTTVVLPIGVRHVSPKLRAHVWFPFVWRFWEPKESSLVIFPIYWRLRQEGGTNADVVFPFYWRIKTPKKRLTLAGPIFSYKGEETYHAGVFPFTYYFRNKAGSHLGALPFIYYRNEYEAKMKTLVVGPFYHRRYAKGSAMGLMPLFFHKRTPQRHYTVVAPIFWHFAKPEEETSVTFVGPFFYRREKHEKSAGLAPIFYTSWDDKKSRSIGLVPLFYSREEIGRSALFTLLFGWDRSPDKSLWYAGPYIQRTTKESTLNIFAPLVWRHRDHVHSQTTLVAAPLYFGRWSPDRSFHAVFPVFFRHSTVDTSATVVLPLVWDFNNRHLKRTTLVLPFFFRHRDHLEKTTSWVFPPGIWVRTKPHATDAIVFPVFWRFADKDSSTTVIPPLLAWDIKGPNKRTTIQFPFYWRFDRPGHTTYFVVNTYFRRNKADDTYNFWFIPLVQVQKRRPGDIMWEVLGGVTGYERVGKNRRLKIFFIPFDLEPTSTKTLSGFGGSYTSSWTDI